MKRRVLICVVHVICCQWSIISNNCYRDRSRVAPSFPITHCVTEPIRRRLTPGKVVKGMLRIVSKTAVLVSHNQAQCAVLKYITHLKRVPIWIRIIG